MSGDPGKEGCYGRFGGGGHPSTEDARLEKTKVFDLSRIFTTKKSDDFLSSRSDDLSDVKMPISDQRFRVADGNAVVVILRREM